MDPPKTPKRPPGGMYQKGVLFVPTGRIIKYPKKTPKIAPPGPPGGKNGAFWGPRIGLSSPPDLLCLCVKRGPKRALLWSKTGFLPPGNFPEKTPFFPKNAQKSPPGGPVRNSGIFRIFGFFGISAILWFLGVLSVFGRLCPFALSRHFVDRFTDKSALCDHQLSMTDDCGP